MGTILRGLLLGLLATLALPCKGAEISCVEYINNDERYCVAAFLQGEIVKGDYDKFVSFCARSYAYVTALYLQSPGGDVAEAMKIGRLLRKYIIYADAPFRFDFGPKELNDAIDVEFFNRLDVSSTASLRHLCSGRECFCASSCAIILFGSPKRMGSVGLHRPIIDDPEFKKLSPAEAERAYKPVLTLISQYLEEMEVPKEFIEAMVATSSSSIRWISTDTEGLKRSPSFAEWEDANCGSSDQAGKELTEAHELRIKSRTVKLSQAE